MKPKKIFVSGPSITQKEVDYVSQAVKNAWYSHANDYHVKFETEFARYIDVRHAIALPSCTSAIHLTLLAKGITESDEVIVPEITWIATAAPISYVGAKPVFVDIDPKSWCIEPDSLKRAITRHTKAVVAVDLYGNMPEYDEIRKISAAHDLFLLEDAAEAIGSEYKGRKAGGLGDVGVFSFHGSKTMTTGEGGMLVTNDDTIYEKSLFYRDHGQSKSKKMFWNDDVAYKYKMSSMQAALGMAQLERIEELIAKKRKIFHWYKERLRGYSYISLNSEKEYIKNTYWMVTAIWDKKLKIEKEEVIFDMEKEGICTRPIFYPLSMLPAYDAIVQKRMNNPNAYSISPYGINLPCGMDMTEEKVDVVVSSFLNSLQKSKGI